MTTSVEVAVGLVYRDGQYLIARRKADVHLAGLWEFPGGKREPGETFEACLARELFEEVHIRIGVPVPFQVVRHRYPEQTVELHFFRCGIESGEAVAVDCAEIRWVWPHELVALAFLPADQPIIAALQRQGA
ncbi:MAG: 8-oxo-dGTP diphosphatase [Nitrospira sp.]|nr:8-oxo-dGTP diphosphatase [Nitrospira sp.]